jgi:hypothetical protein
MGLCPIMVPCRGLSGSYRLLARIVIAAVLVLSSSLLAGRCESQAQALNSNPPSAPVRLVFIHHSVGENLLIAGLFAQLNAKNYYVTDTYYGWPDIRDYKPDSYDIGSYTDIGQWYNWFLSPSHTTYLADLYDNTFINESLSNLMDQPAGPNTVVLFKSCYPNSGGISGNPNDPPRLSNPDDSNPIWGASSNDTDVTTVTNIKGLYRDLLSYFATRQDKLFILLTPPPVRPEDLGDGYVPGSAERARAINTWLVHHWLDNYPYNNVAVFDFFNVLTSNGGNPGINDLGATTGNHHRLLAGQVQHIIQTANDFPAYASSDGHPTDAGSLKAAGEFVPLLNVAYHAWQGTGGKPWFMGWSPRSPAAVSFLLLD